MYLITFISIFLIISNSPGLFANRFLEPGDTIHVVAPSSSGSSSNLPIISNYVRNTLGMNVILRSDIYSGAEPIYSNTDDFRAMDFMDALNDESRAIWCIRGGAGAARLIPLIENNTTLKTQMLQNEKLLIGYSDITVLHSYAINKFNWRPIHGVMLEQIANGFDSESIRLLTEIMLGQRNSIRYNALSCLANCRPISNSTVKGGNLVLVETSIGTSWEVNAKGSILLLEEVGEAPYRIERSLDHLKQAGILDEAEGVLIGDMTGSGNESLLNIVLQRFAGSLNIPVFKVTGMGHGSVNRPVPLNSNTNIINDGSPNLFYMTIDY